MTLAQWTYRKQQVSESWLLSPSENGTHEFLPAPDIRESLGLDIQLPLCGISGIWMPYGDRSTLQKVVWKGRLASGPQWRGSLIAWVDVHLQNRLALLAEPFDEEIEITWALDQAEAIYRIHVEWIEAKKKGTRRGLYISLANNGIHELAEQLLRENAPTTDLNRLPDFHEPSFCTWYAYHGTLRQKEMDACAKRAKDLGFGTFILDDGWAYEQDQRVGSNLGPWHQWNGDYRPSKHKFPDFKAHIEHVQSLGLRYLLWISPFIVGRKTKMFRKLRKDLLPSWLDEGFMIVDPRNEAAVKGIIDALTQLLTAYRVDGFKVDYDYALMGPEQVLFGLGSGYARAVRKMLKELTAINPRLEWNLPVTPFTRKITTATRCVDVPFDPDSNRLFMANLAVAAEGCALYSDPALWHGKEPVSTVHRHLVPSLFIVPSVGAPIMDLPEEHLASIRDWMGFYRRHQRVLNHGHFQARWRAGDFQCFARRLDNVHVMAAFSGYPVEIDRNTETWLINGGHEDRVILDVPQRIGMAIETADGKIAAHAKLLKPGLHAVKCPPGSVLHIGEG